MATITTASSHVGQEVQAPCGTPGRQGKTMPAETTYLSGSMAKIMAIHNCDCKGVLVEGPPPAALVRLADNDGEAVTG
ncbi:MAG: hypothetical protein KDG49_02040 [Geminicoccaceae bacterium]|nr:hypothetical protein [Geminicoccaceae bacterium]